MVDNFACSRDTGANRSETDSSSAKLNSLSVSAIAAPNACLLLLELVLEFQFPFPSSFHTGSHSTPVGFLESTFDNTANRCAFSVGFAGIPFLTPFPTLSTITNSCLSTDLLARQPAFSLLPPHHPAHSTPTSPTRCPSHTSCHLSFVL